MKNRCMKYCEGKSNRSMRSSSIDMIMSSYQYCHDLCPLLLSLTHILPYISQNVSGSSWIIDRCHIIILRLCHRRRRCRRRRKANQLFTDS